MPNVIKKDKLKKQKEKGVIREDYAMNAKNLTDEEGNPMEDKRISLYRDTRPEPGLGKRVANSLGISTRQSKTMIPAADYKDDLVGTPQSFKIARKEGESLKDYDRRVNEDYVGDFMGGYNVKEGKTLSGAPKTVLKNKKTGDKVVIKETKAGDSVLTINRNAAKKAAAKMEANRLKQLQAEKKAKLRYGGRLK
jgi:hypothetical protein